MTRIKPGWMAVIHQMRDFSWYCLIQRARVHRIVRQRGPGKLWPRLRAAVRKEATKTQ